MSKIKSLISSKSKSSKFNSNKIYSSFWMDDNDFYSSRTSRWAGLAGTGTSTSDTVKVIKLQSYRKAIANFVKILTKQDIPVFFAGDTSYTDFKKVVLSTDIKDNNFDVSVGLALHEASHLILTDREYLPKMVSDKNFRYSAFNSSMLFDTWKQLLNWIEDRRIDQYIFSTSPGYKAYYHKMYDHYWNDESITKALRSTSFRDPNKIQSWMFQIVNSLNPVADLDALPRLREIMQLIDTKSIKRLKSTAEAGEIATQVLDIILEVRNASEPQDDQDPQEDKEQQKPEASKPTKDSKQDEEGDQDPQDMDDEEFGEDETRGGQGQDQDGDGEKGDDEQSDDEEGDEEGQGSGNDEETDEQGEEGQGAESKQLDNLSPTQEREAERAFEKQKQFLAEQVKKEVGTKSLSTKLKRHSDINAELQQVGDGKNVNATCIMYDLTKDTTLIQTADVYREMAEFKKGSDKYKRIPTELEERHDALTAKLPKSFENREFSESAFTLSTDPDGHEHHTQTAIYRGLEMGALLGRKMQIRSESRELVLNRTNTGHIDNKRLAHAGYGIENIFKQVTIDKYKKANLHISLDASGSMGGSKWNNTVMMTTAICKAVSMIQNLEVQVSLRCTDGDNPVVVTIYDSRKNKMRQLISAFIVAGTNHMTPEGLCFDAQIKKNLLVPGSKEVDSYFLNLSDGAPGGCGGYHGQKAVQHTKRQMDKLREMNIAVLGFFMTSQESWGGSSDSENFKTMYGPKSSKTVKASDAMEIAKAMNQLFMSKN